MAFMAPAPDQATYKRSRALSVPATYASAVAMSPSEAMSSLSGLEKLMDGAQGGFTSRSGTTSPTGSSYWGQDVVAMLAGGAGAQAGGGELLGSGMVSSDWQALLDSKPAYKGLPRGSTAMRGGIMENARVREILAGRVGKAGAWSVGVEGAGAGAGAGITVDPSKGGLALQGAGLATSHCLAQFSSDPAFAERAAKFSSFGSGKYAQIAVPLPVNEGACKARSRSAPSSSGGSNSGKKLAAAVAEEKHGPSAAAAHAAAASQAAAAAGAAAAERSSTNGDMDVDGVITSDDKSPPGSAPTQPELEAIEGASLAAMAPGAHEVEVPAAREPTNSCSGEQQHLQHPRSGGGAPPPPPPPPASPPARSPSGSDDSDRRKRKNSPPAAAAAADPKAVDVVDSKPKRWKGEKGEDDKAKAERSCSDNSGEDSGSPRAHKESTGSHKNHKDLSKQDYIHVRARRGQATDSHSLAERVRREKISERMKYLQDLVPGCSKVTGKAVMLDEIINYVQSLQRQVENLSMKLASVNPAPAAPRLDFAFDGAMNKELLQSRLAGTSTLGTPESTATFTMLQLHQQQQQHHQQQHHHQHHQHHNNNNNNNAMLGHCGLDFRSMGGSTSTMDGYHRRSSSAPINVASGQTSVETYSDDVSQSIGWDGELQSIVNQMGFGGHHQGRFGSSMLDGLHSHLPVGHMKVEM